MHAVALTYTVAMLCNNVQTWFCMLPPVAPVFLFCPESRTIFAGGRSKRVWWRTPVAVDTDGSYLKEKNLVSTVDPGSELELGVTLVSYVAKGGNGHEAHCRFNITLIYQGK